MGSFCLFVWFFCCHAEAAAFVGKKVLECVAVYETFTKRLTILCVTNQALGRLRQEECESRLAWDT